MRWMICVAIGLILAPTCSAQESWPAPAYRELADAAESAFRQGVENRHRLLLARKHFSDAADAYRKLHAAGVRSPALYRSLGNAAVLADRWPEAIWAYQMGLRLDPNDREMREHLDFVRGKVIYPPSGQARPEPGYWPTWVHRPTVGELTLVAAVAYVGVWLALTWMFAARAWQPVVLVLILAPILVLSVSGLLFDVDRAQSDLANPHVVLTANADFHRGNGPSYPRHPVLPVLPRGMEARQAHRRGDWLMIRLTTGETGWVHVANVLIVEP